jgi:hypothetical protein
MENHKMGNLTNERNGSWKGNKESKRKEKRSKLGTEIVI